MPTITTEAFTKSQQLFEEALQLLPGGVNSPVRAFKAVGGTPPFIASAIGPYVTDVDDQQYIDYLGSWGPMILGHSDPDVVQAVQAQAALGLSYGAPCELEIKLAAKVREMMPNVEKMRMVNSGTEATMSAIRLARGATGRSKIIKFAGCYHGHADSFLVEAGSGALTFGNPSSPGVTAAATQDTLIANYNDLASVEHLFTANPDTIAAVIIEPMAGNMNFVPGEPQFIQGLRELCDRYQSLLIFDEVMTGFRVASGGAQSIYNVKPDLTTLGKIIGGGMPVGAYGGRADLMDLMSPVGPIYQAGTLSGNPLAMAAGLVTLNKINRPDFYEQLMQQTELLVNGIQAAANEHNIPLSINYRCGMFGLFLSEAKPIKYLQQVMACNAQQFQRLFHGLLRLGIMLAPSAYEASFVSIAHDEPIITATIDAFHETFASLSHITPSR